MNGTEAPSGRLGAVLRAVGLPSPTSLGPAGPYLVTTLEHAKTVLTDTTRFDFPMDVSRRTLRSPTADETTSARSPHAITPPLERDAVARGAAVFAAELDRETANIVAGSEVDVMRLLRRPVARSTTAAVLPDAGETERARTGDLVLAWIDSLGPIIGSTRNPRRWGRVRRHETGSRRALEDALAAIGCENPPATAVLLAAGIQVPIAAGAWLLVKLAEDPILAEVTRHRPELSRMVAWETLRLCPPTWITPRITRGAVRLGDVDIPEGFVVLVSPLLLGRAGSLAPGPSAGASPLESFDPLRWDQDQVRPGAWLPFGAGPHACPGRNLGLTQLDHLASWARAWAMAPLEPVRVDQTRGIFPSPATLRFVTPLSDEGAGPGRATPQQDGPA